MRLVASCLLFASLSSHAMACSNELLAVTDWSIKPIDSDTNELTWTVKSASGKPIRMIDAQLGFRDALGGHIASLAIDRDAQIPAGGTYSGDGKWGPYTFERLLNLKREEVTAFTCVRSVLYDDGTKEEFK